MLCLEAREPPPDALADYVAERAGVGARRPHAAVRADREPRRRRADRRPRGRDGAAQAARARVRRPPRGQRRSAAARCRRSRARTRRRSGARTTPCSTAARSSCSSRATDDELAELVPRLPASASEDFGEPFGKVLEAAELGLLRDRSAALQPRRGAPRQRGQRARLPRRRRGRPTSSRGRSGDDPRDRHDDAQPRRDASTARRWASSGARRRSSSSRTARRARCATCGRRGAAVVNLTDDILLFTQAALGDPHPPVARRPRRSTAPCWPTRARGARCGCEEIDDGGPRARVLTTGRGAGDGARVPRLQPRLRRGARGLDPRLARAPAAAPRRSRPSSSGCRSRSTRPRGRASARRWSSCAGTSAAMTVRVEAPARLHLGMLDVVGGGARRFGGLGVAVSRPAAVVEASPAAKLDGGGPGRRARAGGRRALPGFGDAARACACWRRSRRTPGSARARSSRSP